MVAYEARDHRGQLGGGGVGEAGTAGGGSATPPVLKTKKSMDWFHKSFKRKTSSQSLASTSSTSSSAPPSVGGNHASQHGASAARLRTQSSPAYEPLLTIPASPQVSYSPPSSVEDGKSGDDRSSSGGRFSPPSSPWMPADGAHGAPLKGTSLPGVSGPPGQSGRTTMVVTLPGAGAAAHPSTPNPPPSPSYIHHNNAPVIPISLTVDRHKTPALLHSPSSPPAGGQSPGNGTSGPTQSDYEKLLVNLSSRKGLRTMLDDPVGLWKFGQFMASEMNAETLVFWLNAEQHRNDLKRLYSLTQRIHSLHIPSNAPLALNITSQERSGIEKCIRAFTAADDPFKVARDTAFQSLYLDAWPRFLQWRLELLHAKMRQGGLSPPQTSFTLADPSQDRDQPLLLVSDGFLDLSGYDRSDILLRNCRFLQGPGTQPAAVDRIRAACKDGTHATEMLLNYRKDGVPFWSLLRIIPLRNASGKLKYLLGAQINVTAVLAATPDLAHLLADELDPMDMPPRPPFEHDMAEAQRQDTNQAMQSYLNSLDRSKQDNQQKKSEAERREIAKKSSMSRLRGSPNPSPNRSPKPDASRCPAANTPRPKSANRDMHLQAAAALAFDNTIGAPKGPATGFGWSGVPASARPTTAVSMFQRPGTAYSVVDTEGKARAQLSLAEQTQAFNDSSSFYIVLDSTSTTVLFHSENLPGGISVGGDFSSIIGSKVHKRIQERISAGERLDIDSVSFQLAPQNDPDGQWKRGVKICLTPLKDQINEVGAVIVLISSSTA